MDKPLRPTYVNERARIEEHDEFMCEAHRLYPLQPICPDHYTPPGACPCSRPSRRY